MLIGEIATLDGAPRTATVVADTDVVLLVLDRRAFDRLVLDVPFVARRSPTEMARGVDGRRIDAVTVSLPGGGDASSWHFTAVAGVDHVIEMAAWDTRRCSCTCSATGPATWWTASPSASGRTPTTPRR